MDNRIGGLSKVNKKKYSNTDETKSSLDTRYFVQNVLGFYTNKKHFFAQKTNKKAGACTSYISNKKIP